MGVPVLNIGVPVFKIGVPVNKYRVPVYIAFSGLQFCRRRFCFLGKGVPGLFEHTIILSWPPVLPQVFCFSKKSFTDLFNSI